MANEDMNTMLIKLKERYRYSFIVLKEMVRTDFKLRYQGSFLGIAWSVLKPLMLFCVMYVVFVKFLKFTDGTPTFPLVLLLGISLWNFFAEATNMGLTAIVGRGDILRKIHFPNYIIVVSATVGALISLAINMCVVLDSSILGGKQKTLREYAEDNLKLKKFREQNFGNNGFSKADHPRRVYDEFIKEDFIPEDK